MDHLHFPSWNQYYDEHLEGDIAEDDDEVAVSFGVHVDNGRIPATDPQEV